MRIKRRDNYIQLRRESERLLYATRGIFRTSEYGLTANPDKAGYFTWAEAKEIVRIPAIGEVFAAMIFPVKQLNQKGNKKHDKYKSKSRSGGC